MATDFYGLVSKNKLNYRQQGFSGTDLDRNVDDTGIVYPLKQADGFQASFSSIVDHEKGDTILAHSEYRLAHNVPDNIEFIKGICFSVIHQEPVIEKSTEAEALIGIAPYINILKESYLVAEPSTKEFNKEYFKKYDELLENLDFEPVFIIDDKNLSKKEVKTTIFSSIGKDSLGTTLTLWDKLEKEDMSLWNAYDEPDPKSTKKVDRKVIEKDVHQLRREINSILKKSKLTKDDLTEELILLLESSVKDFDYDGLLLLKTELDDFYWDLVCESES